MISQIWLTIGEIKYTENMITSAIPEIKSTQGVIVFDFVFVIVIVIVIVISIYRN